MAIIQKTNNETTNKEEHSKSYSACYNKRELSQDRKVIDNSTISDECPKLTFSAEELSSLLKHYGLENFDWHSII